MTSQDTQSAEKIKKKYPRKIELWQCHQCHTIYPDYEEAKKCIAEGFHPVHKVGDIVYERYPRYGWFEGDEVWIHSSVKDDRSHDRKKYRFYFVITYIDGDEQDGHKPRYHVATRAQNCEKGRYWL